MIKSGSLEINLVEKTSGNGSYGSSIKKDVKITKISWNRDKWGDLLIKIYFDPKTWNVKHDGYLREDNFFIKYLFKQLVLLEKKRILPKLRLNGLRTSAYEDQGKNFIHCCF